MFIIMAELTSRALFKVIRMGRKYLFLVMLLVVIGCQQSSIGQDKPDAASILPSKTAGADWSSILKASSQADKAKNFTLLKIGRQHNSKKITVSNIVEQQWSS